MPYFHVQIIPKSNPKLEEWGFDLVRDALLKRFVQPYRDATHVGISGKWILADDIERLLIYTSEENASTLGQRYSESMRGSGFISSRPPTWSGIESYADDVTADLITGPPGAGRSVDAAHQPEQAVRSMKDAAKVFVVHGRDDKMRAAMFSFLRAIGLQPIEWSQAVRATGSGSPYIGDILGAAFSEAQAIVVLLTPDDEARLHQRLAQDGDPLHETELSGQARPNVLFEAGMAMGRDPDRTVLVEVGSLRPFSDIGGRHTIRFDGSSPRRQELAERLRTAGCAVKLDGTDWHSAGEFDLV